jgi:hypothetical protein
VAGFGFSKEDGLPMYTLRWKTWNGTYKTEFHTFIPPERAEWIVESVFPELRFMPRYTETAAHVISKDEAAHRLKVLYEKYWHEHAVYANAYAAAAAAANAKAKPGTATA